MNRFVLFLSFAAFAAAATAQTTPAKPGAPASKSLTSGTGSSIAVTTKPAAAATPVAVEPWIKLPPGVPRVVHGLVKMPIALRYEDIKVGPGALGESGKLWHLKYTGWRAADGVKFDSWDDHRQPDFGSDGKPKTGPDGKPVMKDPEPIAIPQGMGRVIPGFDYGLEGMKIGGKRRIFIPWQMAYGTRAIPDHTDAEHQVHPGIPAKSDLIFDVELVDVTEMPAPPQRPMMPGNRPMPPVAPHPGAGTPPPGGSAQPNAAPTPKPETAAPPPTSQTAPATQSAPSTSTPAQPAAPAQPASTQPSTPPQR
jgi:peptidylprolyl isomerase